jgi:DNA processing protein
LTSKGCNLLIKQTRAGLIESGKDFIDQMMWDQIEKYDSVQTSLFIDLSSNEMKIIDNIKEHNKLSIDELAFNIQTSQSEMASLLLGLEFKGMIKSLPGKRFMLS